MFTSMVDCYIRLADNAAGTVKQRNHWRKCYENNTPMARGGVEIFKRFRMVKLGAQMRSQSDEQHIEMIRTFRNINRDVPCPLLPHYLETILQYSKNDAKSDTAWTTAPIAVVGNVERLALTANRIKVFAKRGKQPVLKWKQEIKDCEQNELIKTMEQSALNAIYENEEGLFAVFCGWSNRSFDREPLRCPQIGQWHTRCVFIDWIL